MGAAWREVCRIVSQLNDQQYAAFGCLIVEVPLGGYRRYLKTLGIAVRADHLENMLADARSEISCGMHPERLRKLVRATEKLSRADLEYAGGLDEDLPYLVALGIGLGIHRDRDACVHVVGQLEVVVMAFVHGLGPEFFGVPTDPRAAECPVMATLPSRLAHLATRLMRESDELTSEQVEALRRDYIFPLKDEVTALPFLARD